METPKKEAIINCLVLSAMSKTENSSEIIETINPITVSINSPIPSVIALSMALF